MIRGLAHRAQTPAGQTAHELLPVHFDLEHRGQRPPALAHLRIERGRLLRRAREPVEDEARLSVRRCQPLFYEADGDVVGHQVAAVDVLLSSHPHLRALFHRAAEDVAGRDLGYLEALRKQSALRTLAHAWRAEQYETQSLCDGCLCAHCLMNPR